MKPGVIKEEYIAIILRELLKGLDYLHNENKLHRGLYLIYFNFSYKHCIIHRI